VDPAAATGRARSQLAERVWSGQPGSGGRQAPLTGLGRVLLLGRRLGAAVAAERWLGSLIRGEGPDPVMKMAIAIDAPMRRSGSSLGHRRSHLGCTRCSPWSPHPGPVGIGTRGEADVRIFLIGVVDPVEIDVYDPPVAFGIRHVGVFAGSGRSPWSAGRESHPVAGMSAWSPAAPESRPAVQKPILARSSRPPRAAKEMVEARHAEAIGGAGADAG